MWKLPSVRRISKCAAIGITLSLTPLEAAPAVQERPPVLLVHGMNGSGRRMEPLARYLRAHGRTVYTMTVTPCMGQAPIEELAEQVAAFVDQTFATGERFDLVGFSMGGLITRYYLQRLGGLSRVHRFVTVSAPHQGSVLAWLMPNAGGRQMRPGSAFLRDLESDATQLEPLGFTSLWTPLDLTVVPAKSSVIPGADCRRVWCVAHPLMVYLPNCQEAIRLALE